jgi:hypothetical protein
LGDDGRRREKEGMKGGLQIFCFSAIRGEAGLKMFFSELVRFVGL